MSTRELSRKQKTGELLRAMQLMTGQSILLSEAVAGALGLNTTDLEALGIVHARPATTAGDLAAATGLSTGAITSVIDRLEAAGYIRREADPTDRRRILLRVRPSKSERAVALYADLEFDLRNVFSRYSDDQVTFLIEFLSTATQLAERQTAALKSRRRARRPKSDSA